MFTSKRISIVEGCYLAVRDIGGEFGFCPRFVRFPLTSKNSGAPLDGGFDGMACVGEIDGRIVIVLNAESATGRAEYVADEEPTAESKADFLEALRGADAAKTSKPRRPRNATWNTLEAYDEIMALRASRTR